MDPDSPMPGYRQKAVAEDHNRRIDRAQKKRGKTHYSAFIYLFNILESCDFLREALLG